MIKKRSRVAPLLLLYLYIQRLKICSEILAYLGVIQCNLNTGLHYAELVAHIITCAGKVPRSLQAVS